MSEQNKKRSWIMPDSEGVGETREEWLKSMISVTKTQLETLKLKTPSVEATVSYYEQELDRELKRKRDKSLLDNREIILNLIYNLGIELNNIGDQYTGNYIWDAELSKEFTRITNLLSK